MKTLSRLDLIEETQQAQAHRRLQAERPAELTGWALFFQRLGGRNGYCAIPYEYNIITADHPTKRRAGEEAYAYAVLFELLPLKRLQLALPPGCLRPAHYRQLLIQHERRTKHHDHHHRTEVRQQAHQSLSPRLGRG